MGRRGAPKKGEQTSVFAKRYNQQKRMSRNGGSAAASRGDLSALKKRGADVEEKEKRSLSSVFIPSLF